MNKKAENKKPFLNTTLILIGILLLSLSIQLPALFTRHIENDEVILQALAEKVLVNPRDYSLQGTAVLDQLPRIVYDKPLFHHPPLFAYGLALFKKVLGVKFQILFPILASVLTVLIIFAIGKKLYDERIGLIAAFIFSICPIALHASTKIWIDAVLTLFCTLSVYLSILAVKKENPILYILAGISFGLAVLSKISALAVIAPIAYLFLKSFNIKRLGNILYFLIFSIVISGSWLFIFYKTFGTFFPWWIKPSEEPLRMFPFIRMAMDRPWYFYFSNISAAAPIFLFGWIGMIKSIKHPEKWPELIWALSFIGGFTLIGIMGLEGYVTRYILPAIPAMAILSAKELAANNTKLLWLAACVFMAYGLTNAILNAFLFQVADVSSLFYFINFLK